MDDDIFKLLSEETTLLDDCLAQNLIKVTQHERKNKRARKNPQPYDNYNFPGADDDPNAETEYYSCFDPLLRRGAAGADYDGTKYTKHLIFPPFSLRMNAYEKLCRKFLHVYNHHDMPPLKDIIRGHAKSDVVTYFLHQASLINPSGWPNYIRVHGVEDFIKFIGSTFVLHPDSVFYVEEAFNKADFARHHHGNKVVICKTHYRSTLTITFPVRKSFEMLVRSMNILLEELTRDHMVLLQGLISCKHALQNAKSAYSYANQTSNKSVAAPDKGDADKASSGSESSGSKEKKRKVKKAKREPGDTNNANREPPIPPIITNPTLAEELESLLDMAKVAIRMQMSAIEDPKELHETMSTLSLEDQFVNYTIHIPIRKQLIVFFEFDPYDKVT
ncbi:hypothetical protein EON65_17725, partial [archaeon]